LTALDRAASIAQVGSDFEVLTLPRADAGLLGLVRSLLNVSDPRAPLTQMLTRSELMTAFRWLFAVSRASGGQPMAMTEWPILAP
jgi:hypothetical protein